MTARLRRQAAKAMVSTRMDSCSSAGSKASCKAVESSMNFSGSSPSITAQFARRPCRMELRDERAFPSGVLGPLAFAPFAREAAIWAGVRVFGGAWGTSCAVFSVFWVRLSIAWAIVGRGRGKMNSCGSVRCESASGCAFVLFGFGETEIILAGCDRRSGMKCSHLAGARIIATIGTGVDECPPRSKSTSAWVGSAPNLK